MDDDPLLGVQEPLRWRCIDGEWLVFGASSGALFQADPLTAAILSLIEEAPSTQTEIARRIARDTEIDVTPELEGRIGEVVDGLLRAEIVACRLP